MNDDGSSSLILDKSARDDPPTDARVANSKKAMTELRLSLPSNKHEVRKNSEIYHRGRRTVRPCPGVVCSSVGGVRLKFGHAMRVPMLAEMASGSDWTVTYRFASGTEPELGRKHNQGTRWTRR
jgi:hypothetical protein